MLEIKKPKFIRKSDFINYFIRPRDQWFYLETDLANYIQAKIKDQTIDLEEEFTEQEDDSLEMLRLAILNGETIDERDPKVYEGLLIDKQSRDFLKLKYVRLTPYDFDELYKGINNFEYLANETKKILLKDNFILFQPVFIYKNKAVTRPDVLIKEKGKYTIIEVKGTTKPKIKHLVDMIYQHHVINNVLSEFNESIFDYLLCVVKYTKGTRNKIEFIINEHIPLVKDGKDLSDKAKLQFPGLLKYSDQAIEARCLARLDNDSSVTIQKLIQLDSSGLENKKKKLYDARVVPLLDEEEFEKIIDELQAFTPTGEPTLLPDISHFATWFDDYSLLQLIRKYYFSNPKFITFHWSGKIMRISQQYDAYMNPDINNELALRNYMIELNLDYARFFNGFVNTLYTPFKSGVYRTKETKQQFSLLKPNKIYFDFESINPATCVIDDTTPYTQIVTQVSIIENNESAINIVIDPRSITIKDFKNLINQIYHGSNYSYVVYNKSFECSRLKEMAFLINDPEYTQKVETINANIYDLCDFFVPNKNLITIRELGGYYSIKNILPIIQRDTPDIFQQSGAKNYHDLVGIHHGGEALNQTSRRFFGLLSDTEWNDIVHNLKVYCENDVRAMIAVERYINSIIS